MRDGIDQRMAGGAPACISKASRIKSVVAPQQRADKLLESMQSKSVMLVDDVLGQLFE
jgi:hypothetical protein